MTHPKVDMLRIFSISEKSTPATTPATTSTTTTTTTATTSTKKPPRQTTTKDLSIEGIGMRLGMNELEGVYVSFYGFIWEKLQKKSINTSILE